MEDEDEAPAAEPEPKIKVQQIQNSIQRSKEQIKLEKTDPSPDLDLVKKLEERIKGYESKLVDATPPDKRAKEIEQKLITFEESAKKKKASAKKNREEAERLTKLADQ